MAVSPGRLRGAWSSSPPPSTPITYSSRDRDPYLGYLKVSMLLTSADSHLRMTESVGAPFRRWRRRRVVSDRLTKELGMQLLSGR